RRPLPVGVVAPARSFGVAAARPSVECLLDRGGHPDELLPTRLERLALGLRAIRQEVAELFDRERRYRGAALCFGHGPARRALQLLVVEQRAYDLADPVEPSVEQ